MTAEGRGQEAEYHRAALSFLLPMMIVAAYHCNDNLSN